MGVLSERGELCLTITSTKPDMPEITGLRWETVRQALRSSPAQARITILDCCFSGHAIEALMADDSPGIADITHVRGVYTLTATTRNRTAHVPPLDQQETACTSFTGELRDLINAGIPGGPKHLTLADIYPELSSRLKAKDLPDPFQRGTDTAGLFPFALNRAGRNLEPVGAFPSVAEYPNPPMFPSAIRVASLLDESIEIATGASTLEDIAGIVVGIEPTRTESLARRLSQPTGGSPNPSVLATMAAVLTNVDPDRAERLGSEAERQATSSRHLPSRIRDMAEVAMRLAATDIDRSKRLIELLVNMGRYRDHSRPNRIAALTAASIATVAVDPETAKTLAYKAERLSRYSYSERELARVTEALAGVDPVRARKFAMRRCDDPEGWWASVDLVASVATVDPDRAEDLAKIRPDGRSRAPVLIAIADRVVVSDPERARRLLVGAERGVRDLSDPVEFVQALSEVAAVLARLDLGGARRLNAECDRIIASILEQRLHDQAQAATAKALVGIATATAMSDPDKSVQIARAIHDQRCKAVALASVAKVLSEQP